MHWPKKLTINTISRARDGGSQILYCTDERGERRRIELHQSLFPRPIKDHHPIAGRLHIDEYPMELRSTEEAGLIALLRAAEYQHDIGGIFSDADARRMGPEFQVTDEGRHKLEQELRASVAQLIAFVESQEYVDFADQIIRRDFGEDRGGYGRRDRS